MLSLTVIIRNVLSNFPTDVLQRSSRRCDSPLESRWAPRHSRHVPRHRQAGRYLRRRRPSSSSQMVNPSSILSSHLTLHPTSRASAYNSAPNPNLRCQQADLPLPDHGSEQQTSTSTLKWDIQCSIDPQRHANDRGCKSCSPGSARTSSKPYGVNALLNSNLILGSYVEKHHHMIPEEPL